MKAYKIQLTSWTASFRYPNLISGYQPSLPVPPLATLYGLISAAVGDYICADDIALGYVFRSASQTIELETIYQFTSKSTRLTTKPNVIRRQVLFDTSLWLYVTETKVAEAFLGPHFQLLLGRSSDLATVDAVEEIDLEPRTELTKLQGTVVPMGRAQLGAPVQALPISFTNEIPRRAIGTRPFYLLEYDYDQPQVLPEKGFCDPQIEAEIYWHDYTGSL